MAIPRRKRKIKGKCGELKFYPELLIPLTESQRTENGELYRLNPWYTNDAIHILFDGLYEAQARLCRLEREDDPQRINIGALTYTPEVNTYGTFTIQDLEIENYSEVIQLHVFAIYVNEVKPVQAAVASGVDNSPNDVTVTVSITNNNPSDPELTFVEGDYLLWNDATVGSTGRGGHRFEISRLKSINSLTSWTLQRNPDNDSRLEKGYFGSWIDDHAAGIKLYKVQVKHFPWKIKQGSWFGDYESDYERRGDWLWPSRCILATQIIAELSANKMSQVFQVSLIPAINTDTDGNATTSPVSPGLRTLAGQGYIIPALSGEDDVEVGSDKGKIIRWQDLASIRTIYFDCRSEPQGGALTCTMKYRPVGSVVWTDLEQLTIPIGMPNSFSNSTSNNPAKRRMPYTLPWPPPVIPQDAEIGFDIDSIGSVITGSGLVGYIQT